MTIDKPILTPGNLIRAFWEEHAAFIHDNRQDGGRRSLCVASLDNHLIIGTKRMDFAMKWLGHDIGTHRWCLPIPTKEGDRE